MPAKMISEMPLPIPRSLICSPSHMTNAVPVVSVSTVMQPEAPTRTRAPAPRRPASCVRSSKRAMPVAWMIEISTVP